MAALASTCHRWFHRAILRRRWLTFVVMAAAFFAFGALTLNLLTLLGANAELLATHGWLAVMDGGLWQLAELLASGLFGMAAYVVFKTCEHALVHALGDPPVPAGRPSQAGRPGPAASRLTDRPDH